jgi:hypothetical protein
MIELGHVCILFLMPESLFPFSFHKFTIICKMFIIIPKIEKRFCLVYLLFLINCLVYLHLKFSTKIEFQRKVMEVPATIINNNIITDKNNNPNNNTQN